MSPDVLVSLPEGLIAEVDRVAAEQQLSRGELVRDALREYLAAQRSSRPGDRPRVRRAMASMDEFARLHPGTGEVSTEVIRAMREGR